MNQEESKKRFQNFTAQRSAVGLIECSQCDTESDPSPSLKRFLNQDCFVALHGSARRLSFLSQNHSALQGVGVDQRELVRNVLWNCPGGISRRREMLGLGGYPG